MTNVVILGRSIMMAVVC
jgi:hypothetical protein